MVISLDTNILVRLLVNDDKKQAALALQLLQEHSVFIAKTVILETECVLRYTYNLDSAIIAGAFEKLLGSNKILIEDFPALIQALHWYKTKMDFSDALHIASSLVSAQNFATFDKKCAQKAKKLELSVIFLT
jgi:predicted nucleic-acid-binding protein